MRVKNFFVVGLSGFCLCFGVCFCGGWFFWFCFGGVGVFLYVVWREVATWLA